MKSQTTTEFIVVFSMVMIILIIFIYSVGGIPYISNWQRDKVSDLNLRQGDIGILSAFHNGTHISLQVQNNLRYKITLNEIFFDLENHSIFKNLSVGNISYLEIETSKNDTKQITFNYTNTENQKIYLFTSDLFIQ